MASPSTAAIIATDNFESYAVGGLAGNNGGSGWGAGWSATAQVSVASGGLSYAKGSVNINGGSRAAQFIPNEDTAITDGIISRTLASSQTGTVYFSMLFQDSVNPNLPDNDFIQFGFDTGGGNPRTSILRRNGTFQVRSTTTSSNGDESSISSVQAQTYLLVFKATNSGSNYNSISLFVDPDSNTEPGSPDAIINVDSGANTLSAFLGRSAFHEAGDTFLIDELTIGNTFADVVPVPEPGYLAIFIISAVVLLRRQR